LRALFLTSQSALSHTAVRDGIDRAEAAKFGGMDRQTLVHRFNVKGPDMPAAVKLRDGSI
jgi:hypothetical protein